MYWWGKKTPDFSILAKTVMPGLELALVLSHEMAHNALGHMSGKRGSSNPGITVFARESEAQADYVGLYFAARAKYDKPNRQGKQGCMASEDRTKWNEGKGLKAL